MSNIVTIPFHGNELLGFEDDRGVFVALRPMVEGMGLNWSGQLQRVKRDPILSQGVCVMHTPSDGGPQDTVCLPLRLLPGWLFRLDIKRLDASIRDKVQTYQQEAYDVLARAFLKPATPAAIVQAPIDVMPISEARKLVTEARHSFDHQAARQLWFQLGLPIVPAMRAAPFQASLFSYTAQPTGGQG